MKLIYKALVEVIVEAEITDEATIKQLENTKKNLICAEVSESLKEYLPNETAQKGSVKSEILDCSVSFYGGTNG